MAGDLYPYPPYANPTYATLDMTRDTPISVHNHDFDATESDVTAVVTLYCRGCGEFRRLIRDDNFKLLVEVYK